MATPNVLKIVAWELLARSARERAQEPCLVMDDPTQVDAYLRAGSDRGALAPLYLFNTTLASPMIRAGDVVVDLACGPANQLAQLAAVNPDARFIGVDLSPEMLKRAEAVVSRHGLSNVEFDVSDLSKLDRFADRSVDVLISTLALHHLPDRSRLVNSFIEFTRVLKPDGRLYFSDLGQLRSERSVAEFASQYADRQPEVFNVDYLNSLRAAFGLADFRAAIRPLGSRVRLYSTFFVPYMVVVKSPDAVMLDEVRRQRIDNIESALPASQKADLKLLRMFFRLGGLKC
jgi:SAM-dependent methyltransferase